MWQPCVGSWPHGRSRRGKLERMSDQGLVSEPKPGQIDYHHVDRYTLAHGVVGAVLGVFGAPWWLAVGGAVLWEVLENPLKDAYPEAFHAPTHDTVGNAVVDAAAVVVGWGVGSRIVDKSYPLKKASNG